MQWNLKMRAHREKAGITIAFINQYGFALMKIQAPGAAKAENVDKSQIGRA